MRRSLCLLTPFILVSVVSVTTPAHSQESDTMTKARPKWASDMYVTRQIEGWNILVNKEFLRKHSTIAEETLTLLRLQLYQISRCVPTVALNKIRTVRIWVEEDEPNTPCMAYHPDAEWLRQHGVNPEKQKCVELANARNFLNWNREQPWMVLHELAHAFHHQFLPNGFDNPLIQSAYQRAMSKKIYAKVLRISGHEEKAYATSNPMEYFAEATEAFFGTNDFYPFVSAELGRHDPDAYALLSKIWGKDEPKAVRKTAVRGSSRRERLGSQSSG